MPYDEVDKSRLTRSDNIILDDVQHYVLTNSINTIQINRYLEIMHATLTSIIFKLNQLIGRVGDIKDYMKDNPLSSSWQKRVNVWNAGAEARARALARTEEAAERAEWNLERTDATKARPEHHSAVTEEQEFTQYNEGGSKNKKSKRNKKGKKSRGNKISKRNKRMKSISLKRRHNRTRHAK